MDSADEPPHPISKVAAMIDLAWYPCEEVAEQRLRMGPL